MSEFTTLPAGTDASAAVDEYKDSATLASEEGFTGTLVAFLEWLKESLCYGGVLIADAVSEYRPDTKVMRVETVTGGFSSDEHLLNRVGRSALMIGCWESSHRGGLTVYTFPMAMFESTTEYEFLSPEDGVFERAYRVRRIHVYSEDGSRVELGCKTGVELVYQEPSRDICEPDALLVVRPIGIEEAVTV